MASEALASTFEADRSMFAHSSRTFPGGGTQNHTVKWAS